MPSTHNAEKPWDTDDIDKWMVALTPLKPFESVADVHHLDRRIQTRGQSRGHLHRGILLRDPVPEISRGLPERSMANDHEVFREVWDCLHLGSRGGKHDGQNYAEDI